LGLFSLLTRPLAREYLKFIENTARKDFTFSERQAILEGVEKHCLGHRQKSKEKERGVFV
jgi:hypothetical protein